MKVSVLGCGAYGCALSIILNENNNDVTIWTRFEKEEKELSNHINSKLPGVVLPDNIKISTNLKECITTCDLIVIAIPTAFVKETVLEFKDYVSDTPICIASKGIEQDSCLFPNEIVSKYGNTNNVCAISGPSFAIDVANKVPVGLTLACKDEHISSLVMKAFCNDHFKLRLTEDVVGTEICGSIKNVMAIASGMLDGMNMPESTSAMFITESIHDIKELIKALDCNGNTVLSFAGFGDLLLTCTSSKSRNYSFGKLMGSGAKKEEIDDYILNTTIEGLYTLKSIGNLTKKKNIDVPIIDLINGIIYGKNEPKDLLKFLIQKP